MKLLAIDGNSIINRAFYGIKLLTTKDGRYTNAVYGFINILNHLLEIEKPDAVAVAFDLKKPTFRHKEYSLYKAGRKGMPDELASQLPILKEWLNLMGYRTIECEGYEADDILGTLANIFGKNDECVIATGDRDSLQLVDKNVKVLLTTSKMGQTATVEFNEQTLFEKYSLTPPQMIELKALMGDSSDNIPGVAGVGEKTATELIKKFGNIDYIYENLDSLEIKDSLRAKLAAGKDSAFLSRWLGTICKDAPISSDPTDYLKNPTDFAGVGALMRDLEFYKLMDKMGITAPAAEVVTENNSKCEYSVCNIDEFLNLAKAEGMVSAVLNTADNSICFATSNTVCSVDLLNFMELDVISKILEDEQIAISAYDIKSLYKWAFLQNINIKNAVFDPMLAGYLLSPSASSYELERLACEYSAPAVCINGSDDKNLKDAALCFALTKPLKELLEQNELYSLFCDIELPLSEVLASMESEGFLVDANGLKAYGDELEQKITTIQSEIYSLIGYEFNLNSPKQLGVALFEKLGLPTKKKTKSGYSTNAEVLESLKDAHPAVSLLLEYRHLAKLKSTYCDGLISAVSIDGRIHSTFNQTETRTGRISSTEPNLQNIPVRQPEGKVMRKFFVAKEGYVLCDADYSQIELRVLADISGDTTMIDAFNNGIDIHTLTAAKVFNLPENMVTPLMRSRAKAVNFGIVYGIGAFSLAKDIGVTRAEADSFIKGYLNTYKQVDDYMKAVIDSAKQQGYVTTIFGRRRFLPELSSSNGMLRAFGERVARNMPIQGTAADIIKIAMVKVYSRLKAEQLDAKLILQVHDELMVEANESCAEKACEILREEMENACKMKVTLTADVGMGKTWFEAKD
ncbi:MAG: DNA polymerase I [Clostridia bacterium]|nr:DNA polymerase I [Clostridia bacterium]